MTVTPSADLAATVALARAAEAAIFPVLKPGGAADPTMLGFARTVDALDEMAAAGPHLPPADPTIPGLAAAETEYALSLVALLVEAIGLADRATASGRPTPDRGLLLDIAVRALERVEACRARVEEADLAAQYATSAAHLGGRARRLAQTGPAAPMR